MLRFRIGDRIPLTNGTSPILRGFHATCGAFVESDAPVQTCAHHDPSILLGVTTRFWVPAPGFGPDIDRDGTIVGMIAVG